MTPPDDKAASTKADQFATRPADDRPHEPQARFTVLRLHQKGGLGRLMVALDGELNREIALKEILPAFADDAESRRRFIREAEITGALEHPGIVPVYSLGEFPDGRPYYAMRLVRGINLLTAIEDFYAPRQAGQGSGARESEEFEFRQLLGRFVTVCRAIDYAHNRGVIHRDLKPGNIMLGDYGETLVVDWGLARPIGEGDGPAGSAAKRSLEVQPVSPSERAASDRTQAGKVVGTVAYMSPEQAAGRLDLVGPASDIYGLGATLYHLVTGQPPLDNERDDSLLRVQQGRFPGPREVAADVPRPLESICLKAMARQPQDRYATAHEMALDLERFLADEPVAAYREPWSARAWRWTRRHRTLAASLAAAAVVAVAALSAGVVLLGAANRRERAARDEADRNFAASVAERDRAERNFQLAQDAVRQYFIRVSEDTLLNQPGMQPLRDSLLRQALAYFEKFLAERGEDPLLKQEAALAEFYVGRIAETIDSPADALPHYQRAERLQRDLMTDPVAAVAPPDELHIAHGQSLNALGRAHQKLGQLDEARNFHQQAAEIREQLAAAKSDDVERARALASSIMNLGLVEIAQGDATAGLAQLERAQAIRLAQHDAATEPPAPLVRDLGLGAFNIAGVLIDQRRVDAAKSRLRQAIVYFEQLDELDPRDLENAHQLANCRRMLADAHAADGELDDAIRNYRAAAVSLTPLVQRNPDVPEYAADLAGIEMNFSRTLLANGRSAEARDQMQSAVDRLAKLAASDDASPRQRRDYGVALRGLAEILVAADQRDAALDMLRSSQETLAALVREFPQDAAYADDLTATATMLEQLAAPSP